MSEPEPEIHVDSAGHITEEGQPNRKLERIAAGLAEGLSRSEALRRAGSSHQAKGLAAKARQGLAELCRRRDVTLDAVVKSVRDGMKAERSVFLGVPGGIKEIDWRSRGDARKDAIDLLERAGVMPSPEQVSGLAGSLTLVEVNYTQNVSLGGSHKKAIHKRKTAKRLESDLKSE